MDLYSFIKSKAIRDHLREINHQFTTLEAVYIVWQAQNIPIEKKHEAWEYIIENMPDCTIGNPEIETFNLHERLHNYIDMERQEVAAFYRSEPGVVFHCVTFERGDIDECAEDYEASCYRIGEVFQDYPSCKEYLDRFWFERMESSKPADIVHITRQSVYNDQLQTLGPCQNKAIYADVNQESEIVYIYSRGFFDPDSVSFLNDLFLNMYFECPMPFKRGDIVAFGKCKEPVVVDYFDLWGTDELIQNGFSREQPFTMCADKRKREQLESGVRVLSLCHYIGVDDKGMIYSCCGELLDFDAFEGKLTGNYRVLRPISLALNPNTDARHLSTLFEAFANVLLDQMTENSTQVDFCEEQLQRLGLMGRYEHL